MLAIRLQRVGRKKQPLYRVVVSERSKDMYGDHLEILGQYDPHKKEAALKEDRIKHWLSVGAQASASANNLLIKAGILEGDKKKSVSISKKRAAKKEGDKAEDKKDEAPAKDETPKAVEATPEAKPEEAKEESTPKTEEAK
ncbi:MAG: 30S ribosomal protein S16 [Candidatus Komeilibacteria bacterium]|jgi:small subunit ribosomal protein S16|nr:30S ribosomal protein S16 [Candidatus Komeilibacteria bacterium]MBT4447188.1 30S ribosomal protein S16 [Candidatus Komeilibacteria bacterium]